MPAIGLMPLSFRGVVVVALLTLVAGSAATLSWQIQDWRYGRQLEQRDRLQAESLNQQILAAAADQHAEQVKRLALEQRLSASEQAHYKELSNAQTNQARLRDRLATADLRLSVLLDATDSASGCSVPADTCAGGVVHGPKRAQLDSAHAQRIIGITDAGDQGMIALAACQAFVRALMPN